MEEKLLFKTDFLFPPSYFHTIKNCLQVSQLCLPFVRYFVDTLLVKLFCWNFIGEDGLLKLFSWRYFVEALLMNIFCWNFMGKDIFLKLHWWRYMLKLYWWVCFVETLFVKIFCWNFIGEDILTKLHRPTCATHFTSPGHRLGSLKIIVSPILVICKMKMNFRGLLNVDLAPSAFEFIFNLNSFSTKWVWNCPVL